METPLPDPQHSAEPAEPAPRWRWMENRWLVLAVTVVVSTSSMWFLDTKGYWAVEQCIGFMQSCFSLFGGSLPPFSGILSTNLGLLWFYPVALRLGWLRGSIWIGLIGIGVGLLWYGVELAVKWQSRVVNYFALTLLFLVPCLAMIGRRTLPWMAIPASTVFAAFLDFFHTLDERSMALFWGTLAYAAILIFGTKLIPERPLATAPTD